MSRTTIRLVLAAMAVCFTPIVSAAQTTTTSSQTKTFEVIGVNGNDLVVKLPEGTREIKVPEGFRFTVDGKQMAASELKPGMKGTATITTTTTVTPVVVTEVKNGEVVQASGASLLVKTSEGFKNFTQGEVEKRGIKMIKDGAPAEFTDFHAGDRLSATIVTTHPPKIMTQQEVNATLAKAAPAAIAAASSTAASRSASGSASASASSSGASGGASASSGAPAAKTLPKTASAWPLLALASILSMLTGLALTIRRRLAR